MIIALGVVFVAAAALFVHDRWFSHDNIIRNYPVFGHLRVLPDLKLQRGLIPTRRERFARYVKSFRNDLLAITHACGYAHPSQFTGDDVEISTGPAQFKTLRQMEGYTPISAGGFEDLRM